MDNSFKRFVVIDYILHCDDDVLLSMYELIKQEIRYVVDKDNDSGKL